MAQLLILLLLSLALVAPMPIPLAQAAKPPASPVSVPIRPAPIPEFPIEFDLTIETYEHLYVKLSSVLRRTSNDPPYNPPDVFAKHVLARRRSKFDSLPNRWIMVHVKVANEGEATLTLAYDDLYILGFKNGSGHWYMVEGFAASLPGIITLPVKENYGDLIAEGYKNLYTVPLGNQSAVQL